MIKSKAKLPDKLSELILVALEDLAVVKTDPRYEIDLTTWHAPDEHNGLCSVCFAGAVIARQLSPDETTKALEPSDFSEADAEKLRALNEIRMGSIEEALLAMGVDYQEDALIGAPNISDVDFLELSDPVIYARFQSQMRATSAWLAERGL
jgi:hypothetical protein